MPKTRQVVKGPLRFKDLIVYADEDLIVVDKPRGISSLEDKNQPSIFSLSKKFDPGLSLCHRLDKNTSGVLVLARNPEVYRHIALQFQKRKVKKTYLTLIEGVHQIDNRLIDLALHVSSSKKVSISRSGKRAETLVNTEKHFRHYTLLRCEPITGRMHQIRVHLSAIGHPIVGDRLYGGQDIWLSEIKRNYKPNGRREELPLNDGFLLHASSLELEHPSTGEKMTFEAPLGNNFAVVLKVLGKYDRRPGEE